MQHEAGSDLELGRFTEYSDIGSALAGLDEFPEGKIVTGTVTNVLSYGAFASLDMGVEGLIHATEMPLGEGQSPREILSVGQRLQLRVLHVDPSHQRLGFSMILDH